ncbi:UNKNOWN [Stylonychia lemnae]|uniref:Iq calmodulin-binding motif family protein n=1 Tax=Stylonychia lemnae TaxID=5949 RepID=A0A077ZU15_STYLE|nr:UNKNOWN [Stylonychia lemnae]|eukprot:CDW71946.1 UNKNOWN [Stylonychia lemnae]
MKYLMKYAIIRWRNWKEYWAPEVKKRQHDQRSYLYSLELTFYKLMNRYYPVKSVDLVSLIAFIVSSIPSLNECIDKDYFQQIIDKMNKKKIDQVETHISNQVIVNYEKEKEKSKVARFKYLKKKADSKGTIIRKHDDMLNKERQSLQRRDENIKVANRFRVVLRGLENNYASLKTTEEHQELERFHNPKKKGLPDPLDLPLEQTEAYRNKVVYEFFKDCPDKPRFRHKEKTSYYLQTTTGGPIRAIKTQYISSREQIARAALIIQRAIRRWRKKRQAEKQARKEEELRRQFSNSSNTPGFNSNNPNINNQFFVTQSNHDQSTLSVVSSQNKTILIKPQVGSNKESRIGLQDLSNSHNQAVGEQISMQDGMLSINTNGNIKFGSSSYNQAQNPKKTRKSTAS